jgi:hypothetical protein
MNPFGMILIALMAAAGIYDWWHADMWRGVYWFAGAILNVAVIMKQMGK